MEDRIRIIVEAEVQRAIANLRQAQREARNTANNFQYSARQSNSLSAALPKLSAGMAAVGISAAAAGAGLSAFAKSSFDVAASVQASTQVVNRLFGESSDAILEFSKNAADSLGISEKTAIQFSSVYGNLLSGFITDSDTLASKTQEMLQQSAVIAAATGRTIEDVNERIRSGLLGNTEAIEDLGINVNVALIETTDAFKRFAGDKSWEELDFNMQQQIRLAAILEQSYQKYGDSMNDNVISEMNKAKAAFEDFQKAVGDALMPYVEDILPQITDMIKSITDSEGSINRLIGGIQILIESLQIVWNMIGLIVDAAKTGASFILVSILNPIINGVASLSDMLGKLPGMDGAKSLANDLRSVSAELQRIYEYNINSTQENYDQAVQGFNNIYEIFKGNIKKSSTQLKKEMDDTNKRNNKSNSNLKPDKEDLERIKEILLQFEIDYRETMGKNEEAARLSVEAQKEIYREAGVDRIRLEEWVDMKILRSKTDFISGLKRGFHDLALEASDLASQTESLLSNAFNSMENALVDFVTTGTADFKAFADSILKEIARIAIKAAIIAPLERAFSGMFNGGSVGSSGVGANVNANVAHSGGMVGSISTSRSVPLPLFAGAARFHTGGMIGTDEVPIIAQKGERVLNREETKTYNAGSGVNVPVNVVVNNNNNSKVDVNRTNNNQGGVDIEVLIGDIAAKQAATKGTMLNKAISYNSKQELIKR